MLKIKFLVNMINNVRVKLFNILLFTNRKGIFPINEAGNKAKRDLHTASGYTYLHDICVPLRCR